MSDGKEALKAVSKQLHRFAVLITDHDMPKMTGLALISKLRKLKFKGKIILNSATITEKELLSSDDKSFIVLLGKPVNPQKLLQAIAGA